MIKQSLRTKMVSKLTVLPIMFLCGCASKVEGVQFSNVSPVPPGKAAIYFTAYQAKSTQLESEILI